MVATLFIKPRMTDKTLDGAQLYLNYLFFTVYFMVRLALDTYAYVIIHIESCGYKINTSRNFAAWPAFQSSPIKAFAMFILTISYTFLRYAYIYKYLLCVY